MTNEELKKLEDDLWDSANNFRANSGLKSSEYATPVLGLIFLRFVSNRYKQSEPEIRKEIEAQKNSRIQRSPEDIALEKCGFYLPDSAKYDYLLNLPEDGEIREAIQMAMKSIELHRPELKDILPKDEYYRLDKDVLKELLTKFKDIPEDASGDVFGKIYEYFLGKFALSEGQKGGEFFTPTSVVKLIVEIIEPYQGTIYDPACGSGGMFVQSAKFVERHKKELRETSDNDLFIYGQEKTEGTVQLAKMNIFVNDLRGEIIKSNTYQEDIFKSFGKFDYVMANPPFNVKDVNEDSVKDDKRFNSYGLPKSSNSKSGKGKATIPNANYLWINLFATSLKDNPPKGKGRAGLVMANSASDARHSEADIRQTLITKGIIDVMISLPSNMFFTVTLPATLWFFDKAKKDTDILFIDARNIFTQIDRAHREFSEEQVQNIAIISHLHRGERHKFVRLIDRYFQQGMEQLS
jgi:type I restriction enzyme M protein